MSQARASNEVTAEEGSTADLLRATLDEARRLARIEIEIAKAEADATLAHVKRASVAGAIALGATIIVLTCLSEALVLALGGTVLAALAVAAVFAVTGAIAAWVAYSLSPKHPFERTRERLASDVRHLQEEVA